MPGVELEELSTETWNLRHAESRAGLEVARMHLVEVGRHASAYDDMPEVANIVTVFVHAKAVTKLAKALEERLRDTLKLRSQPVGTDGKPLNQKIILTGENTAKVELRPVRKVVFNADKASALLTRKGLVAEGTETVTTITDPTALHAKLKEVQAALIAGGQMDLAIDIGVVLRTAVTTTTRISEEKITGLVTAERLSLTEAQTCFDETVDHSLYDVSK